MVTPFIIGLSGLHLHPHDATLIKQINPIGFIMYRNNMASRAQLKALADALEGTLQRVPIILTDQEGGEFTRLGELSEHIPIAPGALGRLARHDREKAQRASYLNGYLTGDDLRGVGINADCAPVLDVLSPDAHPIIATRCFSSDPAIVSELGASFASGLLDAGVIPIMKHIPGHGRTLKDSHRELPLVTASMQEIAERDAVPFRHNRDLIPWAMICHVAYQCIDPDTPASQSPAVIEHIIRHHIGFKGTLITDDIEMKSLQGSFQNRAERCLRAGANIVLTSLSDCRAIADAVEKMAPRTDAFLEQSVAAPMGRGGAKGVDSKQAAEELAAFDLTRP